MAVNHSMSKLKRKKSSVEHHHPEVSSRGDRSHTGVFGGDVPEPERSVFPAAVWWNRAQLPAVESLWALTLRSALPHPEDQHCSLVPELPHPSTARLTALKLDEQRWCDLSEAVAPFPEPSSRTSSGPDPPRLSPSQQDLSVQTQPAADPPDRPLFSHSRPTHNGETTSLRALTETPQPPLHSWEGAASSSASDRPASQQKKGGHKEEVVGDKEGEEVQRSIRGDGEAAAAGGGGGGGALQCCPMCLLVFPAGFTQMECDGHLAQCLSEVNVDMTW